MSKTVFLISFLTVITASFCYLVYNRTNVCKTFDDYSLLQGNRGNCWFDPDVDATPSEIAGNHGFPFETHQVVTEDGFVLTLFRIPHNSNEKIQRQPVLLNHGILHDALAYMSIGNRSGAFVLSENGFDVWMLNIRGTTYSNKHLKYSHFDQNYWDFSIDEVGSYDLPVVIKYIFQKTGNKKITYIGFSMGGATGFIYSSSFPQEAQKYLTQMILLAPVTNAQQSGDISTVLSQHINSIQRGFSSITLYGFGSNIPGGLQIANNFCSHYPFMLLCGIISDVMFGSNPEEVSPENLPVIFKHLLAGTSFKTLIHFAQLNKPPGSFQKFDYGAEKNLQIYKSELPPSYDLGRINIPVDIFYGKNDFISTEKNLKKIYDELNVPKSMTSIFEDEKNYYAHTDFVYGRSSHRVYERIAQLMKN